jgi:hypothetical protein
MKDFNWIPVMSRVGDNYYPIIFNRCDKAIKEALGRNYEY